MKSNDPTPSIISTNALRLQHERHRRRMAAVQSPTHPEANTSTAAAVASYLSYTTTGRTMPMKPIILSRKRPSGSLDRKKLTELLNEALSISMNFDLTTGDEDDSSMSDLTIKK